MQSTSIKAQEFAKTGTERFCGERRKGLRLNVQVMQISRGLFPLKTSQHLAEITGYSTRSCEYWLSEKSILPSDALAALIQSEWGREYLAVVMAQATPRWWLALKALFARMSHDAAEQLQARKYREMLDEEAEAKRAYSTSPLFQDDPFYQGQPSPTAAMVARRKR